MKQKNKAIMEKLYMAIVFIAAIIIQEFLDVNKLLYIGIVLVILYMPSIIGKFLNN